MKRLKLNEAKYRRDEKRMENCGRETSVHYYFASVHRVVTAIMLAVGRYLGRPSSCCYPSNPSIRHA